MRLHLLAAVAGLALSAGAAQAQIGIYITPAFSRISNSTPDSGTFAFLGNNATSRLFEGVGFGVYDDFSHSTSYDAGVDVRTSIVRGAGAHLNSFLVGPRVSFKPASLPVKPYLQASIGVGGSRAATNPVYANKFQYGVAGGLEYTLASHVDFRVIEVGYGSVQTINSGLFGGQTSFPSSKLINFSTGIVFRLK